MKILLTGCDGFIGSRDRVGRSPLRDTLDRLLADGHDMIGGLIKISSRIAFLF